MLEHTALLLLTLNVYYCLSFSCICFSSHNKFQIIMLNLNKVNDINNNSAVFRVLNYDITSEYFCYYHSLSIPLLNNRNNKVQ